MQIRFEFDTDMVGREALHEKLQEIKNIEEIVKNRWQDAAEHNRRRLLKENDQWLEQHDPY